MSTSSKPNPFKPNPMKVQSIIHFDEQDRSLAVAAHVDGRIGILIGGGDGGVSVLLTKAECDQFEAFLSTMREYQGEILDKLEKESLTAAIQRGALRAGTKD
jgi:hypothetical protein